MELIFGINIWKDIVEWGDPIPEDFWTSPYNNPIICGNCGAPIQIANKEDASTICPECYKKVLIYEKH